MQIELKGLNRRTGTTFVYVTHDQEEAMTMSDRIAVMNAGHLEQAGSAEDIYLRPRSRFVAAFIGETNFLGGTISGSDGALLHVVTPDGVIVGPASGVAGPSVEYSLRPEDVRFASNPAPENSAAATVVDLAYLGSSVRYECLTETGQRFVVRLARSDGLTPETGDAVTLSWDSSNLVPVTAAVAPEAH